MKYLIGIIMVLGMISLQAQKEEVTVSFSEASGEKTLDIQIFSGSVNIKGTDRSDVLIKYTVIKNKEDHDGFGQQADDKNKGMKKIGGGNFKFEIGEEDNEVWIRSQNFMNQIDIEIEAPKNIDINLSKQIGEDIWIENIVGNVNVENNVGSIDIKNVRGGVNASSSAGEINVEFDQINSDQVMSFNTITGNIDLTFPATHKADLKMRTEWGDIYSDMDIETKVIPMDDNKKVGDNGLKVVSNNWTTGSLNGGGPEMTIKTQMGSIYLRAKQ